jgi:hypothetical protein
MPHAVQRHFDDDATSLIGVDRFAMTGDRFHLEVAKLLLERKQLSLTGLATALRMRAKRKTGLAGIIIAYGKLDPAVYYRGVAELYGLPFVDLAAEPPDPAVPDEGFAVWHMRPWREEDGRLLIATSAISKEHIEWADARFGENGYDFVIAVPDRER